eukprot:1171880-Rhodomonas_salina.1
MWEGIGRTAEEESVLTDSVASSRRSSVVSRREDKPEGGKKGGRDEGGMEGVSVVRESTGKRERKGKGERGER